MALSPSPGGVAPLRVLCVASRADNRHCSCLGFFAIDFDYAAVPRIYFNIYSPVL